MLKKSFKCSYLNIDTKLNKKDYIKMDKKQIQEEKKHDASTIISCLIYKF